MDGRQGGYHAPDWQIWEKEDIQKIQGKGGIDDSFLNYQPEKSTQRGGDTMPGLGGYHKPD
jgi:hypothetical protein